MIDEIDKVISTLLEDKIVLFKRIFATISGSINAGLFLSQSYFWCDKGKKQNYFYKTQKEWEDETGLTRYEQEGARKLLLSKGILYEKKEGYPPVMHYSLDFERIRELIKAHVREMDTGSGIGTHDVLHTDHSSCAEDNHPYCDSDTYTPLYTQNTAKNTQEITHKDVAQNQNPVTRPENGHTGYKPAVAQKELLPIKHIPRIAKEHGLVVEAEKFYKDEIKKLTLAYGGTVIVDAFQLWADNQTGDIKYPVGKFCKVATSYIQGTNNSKKEHPSLQALCISLYKIGDNPFTGKHKLFLNTLLDSYKFQEIEQAYKDFINGKDEYDMKFAAKNFTEGAAETIILTNREVNERKRLQLYQMNEEARIAKELVDSVPIVEDIKEEL